MGKKEERHCGTCAHWNHKYRNWWDEPHFDGGSRVCLITHKDVDRFDGCNVHSGLTMDGYDSRKEYKPIEYENRRR
jgi:hypothetical protein